MISEVMTKWDGKATGLSDSCDEERKRSRRALTPGCEGRVGSLRPFDSGPDAPGGGGLAVLRGRLPRQLQANPEARHFSRRAQSCLSKTLEAPVPSAWPQTLRPQGRRRQSGPPGSRMIRPAPSNKPAMSLGGRASFDPPFDFRRRFRFLRKSGGAALSAALCGGAVAYCVVWKPFA